MNNTFNANFFIVAATINPIFFLALTIQGTFHGALVERIDKIANDTIKAVEEKRLSRKENLSGLVAIVPWGLAVGILVLGIGGEIQAIFALYNQSADKNAQSFVFWTTVGMICLTAVTPSLKLMRAFINLNVANIMSAGEAGKEQTIDTSTQEADDDLGQTGKE